MLQLLINGKQAVLPPDFSVLLERSNPLLEFDGIRGARALNFKLPYDDVNNAIFGFYGNRNVSYKHTVYQCEKLYKGRSVERGYLKLLSSQSDFEVLFTENLSNIFGDYDTYSLQKLPFADIAIPGVLDADADEATDAFCWPMIRNDQFYGSNQGGYMGYVNKYADGVYEESPKVPFFFLRWVFEQLTAITGVKFTGNFLEDDAIESLILYNTNCLDGLSAITPGNHLPDMSIREFINELRKLFNLAIWPNVWKKEIRIDFAKNYFAADVAVDWSKKFGKIRGKKPVLDSRLELDWEVESSDAMVSQIPDDLDGYLTDAGSEIPGIFPVTTKFSTLAMQNGLPIASQQGVSALNGQQSSKFAPRLLFWRGLTDGLPLASTSSTGSPAVKLKWNGANGLKETYWEEFEKFRLNTHIYEGEANLNAYDLALIDSHRRAGELVKVHVQGYNYMIGRQQITLPGNRLPVLELWKC